jgi:hypothetical protein
VRPEVSSVGVHPGLVATEVVLQFAEHLDFSNAQSPEGVGRVVAALATDPDHRRFDGQVLDIDELAKEYGVEAGPGA